MGASKPTTLSTASPRRVQAPPPGDLKPKLLDQLREALRSRHYSRRTEETYCHWVKRFIFFHHVRHPAEMAEPEINAFLTDLAVKKKVSASTQNQALSALLFLYRHVIGREVGDLGEVIRARKPTRLPVVRTRGEVKAVLANLRGDKWLMASLGEEKGGEEKGISPISAIHNWTYPLLLRPSGPRPIPSAIPSPLTCWKAATISERSRNSWGIAMSRRP